MSRIYAQDPADSSYTLGPTKHPGSKGKLTPREHGRRRSSGTGEAANAARATA